MDCKIAGRQARQAAKHFERLSSPTGNFFLLPVHTASQPSGGQTACRRLMMDELNCMDTTNSEFVHMLMERLDKEHERLKDFVTEQLAPVATIVHRPTFTTVELTHFKTRAYGSRSRVLCMLCAHWRFCHPVPRRHMLSQIYL